MKYALIAAATAAGLSVAAPANAAELVTGSPTCSLNDVGPAASACAGFFVGNLTNASNLDLQADALALLGFDGNPANIIQKLPSIGGGSVVDFTQLLRGLTIIGIHRGGGGNGSQGTAFYRWDNIATTDKLSFNLNGLSNAVLYTTSGVPEPATWSLMIAGIGFAGFAMRRRRKVRTTVSYA